MQLLLSSKRYQLILVLILTSAPLLTGTFQHLQAGGPIQKKNVLLIIADDLTATALGCYGNRQCRTPHIDKLASRGIRFENAYCQFPVCGPSRAAMMSGMYCQNIGVIGNGASDRFTANLGNRPSLGQHFKNHGWYSARVSKIYHMRVPGDITAGVDGPDHKASWDDAFNCQGPEWMSAGKHEHLSNEKLKRIPEQHYKLGFGGAFYTVRTQSAAGDFQPDKIAADKAIQLLRSKKDSPFFMAVGFVRPHVPLVAPEKYFEDYPAANLLLPEKIQNDWQDIPKAGISKNTKSIGLNDQIGKQKKILQAYYASVAYMDHQVGRVLAELDRLGLRNNTIVIFKSDHGYHLGEHDFWQKMSLHEESTRIPLIVSIPGGSHAGKSSCLVEAIDLFPTLSALCGMPIPEHCQGKDLRRVLQNPKHKVRDAAYCMTGRGHMIRSSRWAYILYKDGSNELYDMKNDPQQITNLANDASHRTTLNQMKTILADKLQSLAGPD
ncbi:MAG: sulfatase [Pirellulaceae bacterium]|nr:sulfatase [Pirellulaceae bacterium]